MTPTKIYTPCGRVEENYLKSVEKFQETGFIKIGTFDPHLLLTLATLVIENVVNEYDEVDLLYNPSPKTGSTLLVVKHGDEYYAVAGLTDKPMNTADKLALAAQIEMEMENKRMEKK